MVVVVVVVVLRFPYIGSVSRLEEGTATPDILSPIFLDDYRRMSGS